MNLGKFPMKILDKKHTLKKQLSSYADANIVIVSAFVSGILDHLKKIIKKNTHVSLYTGILNGFNNPRELEDIANLAKKNKKFDFYVNFDKKTSTHWKLYLIAPSTVISGSANYTNIGLKTIRDTMILVKKQEIHEQYMRKILADKKFCNSKESAFWSKLKTYDMNHKESYAQDVANEVNVEIPLFIWNDLVSKEEQMEILDKVNKCNNDIGMKIDKNQVRDYFYMPRNENLYKEGERVFCVRRDGKYPSFHYFDRIFSDEDTTYMISLKRSNSNYGRNPITVKDMVQALKKMNKRDKKTFSRTSVSLNELLNA